MAQGVWSGIGLGAVFSLGVAGAISVMVPLEPQPAPVDSTLQPADVAQPMPEPGPGTDTAAETAQPAGLLPAPGSTPGPLSVPGQPPQVTSELEAELDAPAIADAPVSAPDPRNLPPTASAGSQPAPPALPNLPVLPNLPMPQPRPEVTASLPPPQTGGAGMPEVPRSRPILAAPRAGEDAPVLPNPQALAPMMPDDTSDLPVPPESPPVEATGPGEGPAQVAPAAPSLPVPPPRPRVLPAPAPAPIAGSPVPESQTESETEPEPETEARPSVGRPATSILNRLDPDGTPASETLAEGTPEEPADLPPLRRNAQPFENAAALPLMSIVLMDSGADLDADGVGLPALSSFPYPVSFAVDAGLPDARARMERYRAEGFEVLVMVDLPEGARATDAEVSLGAALDGLPDVVAVLEGTGAGLQATREVADQVTGILKASGHGLVTQNRGLNSMPNLAVKEGVAAAPVFRDFDSEDQTARVIRRFLDQAAFRAGQEGAVIMLGRLRPETIEALLVWGLADRAGSVALAPVSAVLLQAQ